MKSLKELERGDDIRYFFTKGYKLHFPLDLSRIDYQTKIDLEHGLYAEKDEEVNFPTLEQLVKDGKLTETQYVYTYDITLRKYKGNKITKVMDEKDITKIIKDFNEHGINVTREAIEHNYSAWYTGLKSGYRDEVHDYHLFTPNGGNPLSFRASRLDPQYSGWQKTYIC